MSSIYQQDYRTIRQAAGRPCACPRCRNEATQFDRAFILCPACDLVPVEHRQTEARDIADCFAEDERRGQRTGGGGNKGRRQEKPGDKLLRKLRKPVDGGGQPLGPRDREESTVVTYEPRDKRIALRCTAYQASVLRDIAQRPVMTAQGLRLTSVSQLVAEAVHLWVECDGEHVVDVSQDNDTRLDLTFTASEKAMADAAAGAHGMTLARMLLMAVDLWVREYTMGDFLTVGAGWDVV